MGEVGRKREINAVVFNWLKSRGSTIFGHFYVTIDKKRILLILQ